MSRILNIIKGKEKETPEEREKRKQAYLLQVRQKSKGLMGEDKFMEAAAREFDEKNPE